MGDKHTVGVARDMSSHVFYTMLRYTRTAVRACPLRRYVMLQCCRRLSVHAVVEVQGGKPTVNC